MILHPPSPRIPSFDYCHTKLHRKNPSKPPHILKPEKAPPYESQTSPVLGERTDELGGGQLDLVGKQRVENRVNEP